MLFTSIFLDHSSLPPDFANKGDKNMKNMIKVIKMIKRIGWVGWCEVGVEWWARGGKTVLGGRMGVGKGGRGGGWGGRGRPAMHGEGVGWGWEVEGWWVGREAFPSPPPPTHLPPLPLHASQHRRPPKSPVATLDPHPPSPFPFNPIDLNYLNN